VQKLPDKQQTYQRLAHFVLDIRMLHRPVKALPQAAVIVEMKAFGNKTWHLEG
jgi:hypothetical protein